MYQHRAAYIDEINNFINSSKNSFNNVLKTINWTKQSLLSGKEFQYFQNPEEDKSVTDEKLSPRPERTHLEGQVYILEMHYGNPLQTISFLQHTSGGGDQLYNDIVASLLVADQPIKTEKKDVKTEDKAAALIQLLKMERDAKRRRISYKNKVHIKNKSHTEVLREVLEEQMLTITGVSGNDSATATSDRLQPSLNQTQELIALRPPQGNPHLAWLDILKKAECDRKRSDHHAKTHRSIYSSHNRQCIDQKERSRYEEEKERKNYQTDRKRKEDGNSKHHDREKKEWDELDRSPSPNYKDRHYKKKRKKRSRSHSPRPHVSNHKHTSKHKKKKY